MCCFVFFFCIFFLRNFALIFGKKNKKKTKNTQKCHKQTKKNKNKNKTQNKYSNHGKYPEMALCQSLMDAFAYANEEMLETVHKSGDLGLFLFHPIANLAKKLTMKDVKPMIIQNNDNNNNSNNNNQQNNPFAQDVTNDQLQSEANNTNINDDTGAPDLLD